MLSRIKAAGDYLLSVLITEKSVAYSRFYNDVPGTDVTLVEGMWPFLTSQSVEERGELGDDEKIRLLDEAHLLLEWAACQLEDLGVVQISPLDNSKLMDEELDFRIELTDRGTRFIDRGETFGYRDPERTRFDVSEASRWMLLLLAEGGPGETLTLNDVTNPDYHDDSGLVTDDWGNVYHDGRNSYAWGFEVCLWHHARNRHIEPVLENEAQKGVWEDHMRHAHLPPRPESSVDRLLWRVPFRLVDRVDPDQVQHVGRIGG